MTTSSSENAIRSRLRHFQRLRAVRSAKSTLRAARQIGPLVWRLATSRHRALPDLMIVGAQKAGTTQLFASMARHPACFAALKKEVQYFSKQANRSVSWYRSHFALQRTVQRAGGVTFEATPSYLPSPAALKQMHATVPGAKVVVLLRDPVSRAFSHYQHYKTRQLETRSFAQAVDEILRDRPIDFAERWLAEPNADPLYDYVARGYYALQLQALWRLYDSQNTLVMDSSELFADTDAATQRVFDFVGLRRFPVPPKKVYNIGHYREKIGPEVAVRLREHYEAHDQELAKLLGQPLSWMKRSAA
ncbi:sulfotransferase domain-containing protein [Rubripirellula amarantea]|nr:sulfotransferase domain-containing protein [Rubripirellula amarantea]